MSARTLAVRRPRVSRQISARQGGGPQSRCPREALSQGPQRLTGFHRPPQRAETNDHSPTPGALNARSTVTPQTCSSKPKLTSRPVWRAPGSQLIPPPLSVPGAGLGQRPTPCPPLPPRRLSTGDNPEEKRSCSGNGQHDGAAEGWRGVWGQRSGAPRSPWAAAGRTAPTVAGWVPESHHWEPPSPSPRGRRALFLPVRHLTRSMDFTAYGSESPTGPETTHRAVHWTLWRSFLKHRGAGPGPEIRTQ